MFVTVQRTKLLGVLVLSGLLAATGTAAIGCGDDDKDNNNGGDGDGDGDGDAGKTPVTDAGLDASTPLSCGEGTEAQTCESVALLNGAYTLDPCCAQGEGDACGLDMTAVGKLAGGLFTGCVARNQPSSPANKPTSNSCTGFWETIDDPEGDGGVTTPNGYTLKVAGMSLSFAGCCRVNAEGNGECGFSANTVLGAPVNFGCLPLENFRNLFDSQEQFDMVKGQATCDKTTGEAASATDGGVGDGGAGDAAAP